MQPVRVHAQLLRQGLLLRLHLPQAVRRDVPVLRRGTEGGMRGYTRAGHLYLPYAWYEPGTEAAQMMACVGEGFCPVSAILCEEVPAIRLSEWGYCGKCGVYWKLLPEVPGAARTGWSMHWTEHVYGPGHGAISADAEMKMTGAYLDGPVIVLS